MRKIATVKLVEKGVERTLRAYATIGMSGEDEDENKAENELQLFSSECGMCYKIVDMDSPEFVSVDWE